MQKQIATMVALQGPFPFDAGYCWKVELPPELTAEADEPGHIQRSDWILFEDESPAGAPHAPHDTIRSQGLGAFSHWKDTLYFSASDNSDPNNNRRAYSLRRRSPGQTVGVSLHSTRQSSGDVDGLKNILRERHVSEVVYFHCDHFEPWSDRSDPKRWRGLERFLEATRKSPYGAKQTLFYTPWLRHALSNPSRTDCYADGDDGVVFLHRPAAFLDGCRNLVRPLESELGHEFQIHVHHEGWTHTSENYGDVSSWVREHSTLPADSRRLAFYVGLCREVMEQEIGRRFDRWAYVHGNWALNAADPKSCQIEDEIAILMQQGCYGDFTFPAGESVCDPISNEFPYSCRPIVGVKAYDRAEADPILLSAAGNSMRDDRFFIWNSRIKATHSSLDFFSEENCRLYREPEALVRIWLEDSVVIGDRLYIKTHAHSLHTKYEPWTDGSWFPHTHPDVVKVFELLHRVCDDAGIPLKYATVNDVMTHLRAYDRGDQVNGNDLGTSGPSVADTKALPLSAVTSSMLSEMQEMAIEPIDSYYASRVARQAVLEPYEQAVLDYARTHFAPDRCRIFEVGIGWGMLSICLAASGYDVVGFVGQRDHADAADRLCDRAAILDPGIKKRLTIVRGLFPDAMKPELLATGRRNVVITTNLVHSFSADNGRRILDGFKRFDLVLLDVAKFGISRNEAEASRFREDLQKHFQITDTIWRDRLVAMKPCAKTDVATEPVVAAEDKSDAGNEFRLHPKFTNSGGHCWVSALPPEFETDADVRNAPRHSQWQLVEDGVALARPHSLHADIAELGRGRYSHWKTQLYFSTSDNTDPNVNGRVYALRWVGAEPKHWLGRLNAQASYAVDTTAKECAGLIAIFGASFSGSTLINSVLGAHPKIFGGGELHWLFRAQTEGPICAICRGECKYWTPQARAAITPQNLYHQVSKIFGRPFVADASKMRDWFANTLKEFPDLPVARILLVKHPVRHVSSFIEKKETAGKTEDGSLAFGTWQSTLQRLRAFYEGFVLPGEGSEVDIRYNLVADPTAVDFVIRYEDFVAAPAQSLAPILSQLGLSYDPKMDNWAEAEHHHIGGNVGPRVQINQDVPALETAVRKYQRRGIFLDNSYSEILDLETIEKILHDPDCVWIRKRFGYPVPAEASQTSIFGQAGAQTHAATTKVRSIELKPPFAADDGFGWQSMLDAQLTSECDDGAHRYRSTWYLLENGRRIGAPHAVHADIRAIGKGRHSHWKDRLYFSASDNSDPNTNGYRYEISSELGPVGAESRSPGAGFNSPEPRSESQERGRTPPERAPSNGLSEILKRRGVRQVAYFHTDHFEPWGDSFDEGIRRLEGFAQLTRQSRYGRRLNLFYTPPISYELAPDESRDAEDQFRVPGDAIAFTPLTGERANRHRELIRQLVDLGHEFHIHIHHTRWTRNTGNVNRGLAEWLASNSTPATDSNRFELFTKLARASMADATGRPFDHWAFIHGLWALNASDHSACMIDDEIEILMRQGCFGDFTFPAGRGHCDPTVIEAPYTCAPVVGEKAYDREEADLRPLSEEGADLRGRFFIWNSAIKANRSSLDYYHEPNRVLFADPEAPVAAWLSDSVVLNGTLYIKTHSHSLEPSYRIGTAEGISPHVFPDVIRMFETLERACDQAQVPLDILTVNDLIARLGLNFVGSDK